LWVAAQRRLEIDSERQGQSTSPGSR
jgi:hypothetical protein